MESPPPLLTCYACWWVERVRRSQPSWGMFYDDTAGKVWFVSTGACSWSLHTQAERKREREIEINRERMERKRECVHRGQALVMVGGGWLFVGALDRGRRVGYKLAGLADWWSAAVSENRTHLDPRLGHPAEPLGRRRDGGGGGGGRWLQAVGTQMWPCRLCFILML